MAAVGSEQSAGVIQAQILAPVLYGNFTEGVKLTFFGGLKNDIATKKEIELTREWVLWAQRTLSDCFDQTVFLSEPVNDQTGIGESRLANDNGASAVHEINSDDLPTREQSERLELDEDGAPDFHAVDFSLHDGLLAAAWQDHHGRSGPSHCGTH